MGARETILKKLLGAPEAMEKIAKGLGPMTRRQFFGKSAEAVKEVNRYTKGDFDELVRPLLLRSKYGSGQYEEMFEALPDTQKTFDRIIEMKNAPDDLKEALKLLKVSDIVKDLKETLPGEWSHKELTILGEYLHKGDISNYTKYKTQSIFKVLQPTSTELKQHIEQWGNSIAGTDNAVASWRDPWIAKLSKTIPKQVSKWGKEFVTPQVEKAAKTLDKLGQTELSRRQFLTGGFSRKKALLALGTTATGASLISPDEAEAISPKDFYKNVLKSMDLIKQATPAERIALKKAIRKIPKGYLDDLEGVDHIREASKAMPVSISPEIFQHATDPSVRALYVSDYASGMSKSEKAVINKKFGANLDLLKKRIFTKKPSEMSQPETTSPIHEVGHHIHEEVVDSKEFAKYINSFEGTDFKQFKELGHETKSWVGSPEELFAEATRFKLLGKDEIFNKFPEQTKNLVSKYLPALAVASGVASVSQSNDAEAGPRDKLVKGLKAFKQGATGGGRILDKYPVPSSASETAIETGLRIQGKDVAGIQKGPGRWRYIVFTDDSHMTVDKDQITSLMADKGASYYTNFMKTRPKKVQQFQAKKSLESRMQVSKEKDLPSKEIRELMNKYVSNVEKVNPEAQPAANHILIQYQGKTLQIPRAYAEKLEGKVKGLKILKEHKGTGNFDWNVFSNKKERGGLKVSESLMPGSTARYQEGLKNGKQMADLLDKLKKEKDATKRKAILEALKVGGVTAATAGGLLAVGSRLSKKKDNPKGYTEVNFNVSK
ncbi:MAG: hypothetical protein UU06_C0012G0002 [Parcubacteria group bacterium GW2011_GWB1_40_5]|nr:MAG: hypothetical protein UU06_C0012G0002 [Parcubacteria group bacterium GW2011_GWB1_40_5]OHA87014.1 MAG: hypothetical protein A2123_02135 [Candidatus Zambryskibacteria bacterium GWB1_40_5]